MVLSRLQLLNSFAGLIIMYVTFAVPFCTWMMKGFFDAIPTSLDEAALIDGASEFDVFFRVILPLTLPGIAVTAFFSFIIGWNEYMFASIVMRDYSKWTFPVGLSSFQGQYTTDWTIIMAGSVAVTAPIVAIFLALQKFLVGGMTAGAVKQ
jgi:ABC-type glycerol-3-phosphate transport system permease component